MEREWNRVKLRLNGYKTGLCDRYRGPVRSLSRQLIANAVGRSVSFLFMNQEPVTRAQCNEAIAAFDLQFVPIAILIEIKYNLNPFTRIREALLTSRIYSIAQKKRNETITKSSTFISASRIEK